MTQMFEGCTMSVQWIDNFERISNNQPDARFHKPTNYDESASLELDMLGGWQQRVTYAAFLTAGRHRAPGRWGLDELELARFRGAAPCCCACTARRATKTTTTTTATAAD